MCKHVSLITNIFYRWIQFTWYFFLFFQTIFHPFFFTFRIFLVFLLKWKCTNWNWQFHNSIFIFTDNLRDGNWIAIFPSRATPERLDWNFNMTQFSTGIKKFGWHFSWAEIYNSRRGKRRLKIKVSRL